MLKILSDVHNMKILDAIYTLTRHDENAYADMESIAAYCALPMQTVSLCIENPLSLYLREKTENDSILYRMEGRYMHIIPMLSALCNP